MKIQVPNIVKSPTFLLVLSIAIIGITSLQAYSYLSGADARAIKSFDAVKVLVSVGQITEGVSLGDAQRQGLIETKLFPLNSRPAGSLEEVKATNKDLVAQLTIKPGQVLFTENFDLFKGNTGLLNVPKGQIALTVELNYATRVGNFMLPGARIVIFATSAGQAGVTDRRTVVLLEDIEVLAVGARIARSTETLPVTGESTESNFVTVAVSDRQAEKLIQASQTGTIQAGLLADSTLVTKSSGVTDKNIYSGGN